MAAPPSRKDNSTAARGSKGKELFSIMIYYDNKFVEGQHAWTGIPMFHLIRFSCFCGAGLSPSHDSQVSSKSFLNSTSLSTGFKVPLYILPFSPETKSLVFS